MADIKFRDTAHRDFFLENMMKCRVNDCYHRAFFYVMGIASETRANINQMFNFKEDCIEPEGMHGGWQTSGTVKVCHLAFNLWKLSSCASKRLRTELFLGGSAMAYHIEEKKSIRIIGIRIPLVEDAEENMRNVPAFWKKAVLDGSISKLAELSNKNPDGILGVSVYNNPEDIYYYIAVSSNIPVPEGMVEYMIPEGMWVVFENDGVFKEDVQSVFRRFLTEFLPFSGYEYAGLPDVEIYPVCKGQPSKGHSEVWIAIKKAKEI